MHPKEVNLADLVNFLVHPARGFLRQRLGVRVPELDDDIADSLATELDPLSTWALGDRMLLSRLAGRSSADFRAAEWRRGTLPPYNLGATVLATSNGWSIRLPDLPCRTSTETPKLST